MKNFFAALSFMSLSFFGCSQHDSFDDMARDMADEDVPIVIPEDVDPNAVVFLDSRSPEEYKVSHIKGARFIGYKDFELSSVADIPKGKPIVVYCSVGYRSGKVGKKLLEAGYLNVQNLYGGIFNWVNQGKPVYHDGEETYQIHPYSDRWGKWLTKGKKVYE